MKNLLEGFERLVGQPPLSPSIRELAECITPAAYAAWRAEIADLAEAGSPVWQTIRRVGDWAARRTKPEERGPRPDWLPQATKEGSMPTPLRESRYTEYLKRIGLSEVGGLGPASGPPLTEPELAEGRRRILGEGRPLDEADYRRGLHEVLDQQPAPEIDAEEGLRQLGLED